jgi:hypothetical protein
MGQLPHMNVDGSSCIALRPCPTVTVAQLLDPSVPFVWVVGHSPHRVLEWWKLDLPVAHGEPPRSLQVRNLWCELLFDTSEFMEVAGQFDGLTLYQMARRVPNTLIVERLPEERLYSVLRDVGLSAHFYQPHSMEVAMYRSWDQAWIERLLTQDLISSLAY